jgi:hypothetical protein
MPEDILALSVELEEKVRKVIADFQDKYKSEIHSIICYAYFSPVDKQVHYAVKADVREVGQMFIGISS